MKYIFDTSFLVALYFLDDSNHEKAIERFSLFSDEDIFYINELTYTELLTVFTYKKWFQFVKEIKFFIENSNTIFINSWNFDYIRYFEFLEKKISVVDVSILYDSLKYSCEILTFDEEILKLSKI